MYSAFCVCLISYLARPSQDIFYEIHCGHTSFALQFLACKRLSIQLEMNSYFKALGICAGGRHRHRHITGFDKINMFSNCQQLPRRNFFLVRSIRQYENANILSHICINILPSYSKGVCIITTFQETHAKARVM